MSTVDEDYEVSICANCGKGEEESNKLKACTACKLVKYCNRECQIAHRPQHKKECKKRAAELHDEELFKHPPPKHEDCPICFTRIPTFETGSQYMVCCGKVVCTGCIYAPLYDHQGNEVDNEKCPFCRTPWLDSDEEELQRLKKREGAGDAEAIFRLGYYYREGVYGIQQNNTKALELYHRSAELGYADAYCGIGSAYDHGEGVEVDKKKVLYYWELAAMKGDTAARHNLGHVELEAGNMDRAFKHWMISARGGYTNSLSNIKQMYSDGYVTKEDYTKALQSYQSYLTEIKSDQRDKAVAADERNRYY